ncbi:MAG: tRNA (guanosine(46)-N7)-methyltransferase TrmB [Rhizomicrobium sp.]
MSAERRERLRGLLYGRRKGPKLSAHQAALFETLLPHLALTLESGCDPRSYFTPPVEDVWLEIGFGGGEHLLWQAEHHPNIGLIGAEPYQNGVAKLLAKLAAQAWNVRIYEGDAREIIASLPDASLGRVFLLFPDPWPKKRHHKRRFIQVETLDALARVMKPGAEFRFASDDENYIAWTLERILAHHAFEWPATRAADWCARAPDWPATRYEGKALHGPPVFLRFCRIGESA